MLHVELNVTPVGEAAANAQVGPVNNFLHSLFSQVDVFFNNKLVTPSSNCYAYRSYIETLLNYSSPAKESHLTCALFYADQPGRMNAAANAPAGESNSGLVKRRSFILNGQALDMIGHLHCDVFNQDKMLINGVEVRVRLTRSKDEFCLMDASEGGLFRVNITDATLIMRRVKVSPGVLLAHSRGLSKTTAKYPITRVEIKNFNLQAGIMSTSLDNIFLGQLPKRIIVGFVDNRAFNGNRTLNPFNFEHINLSYLSLYVDGVQVPSKPLTPRQPANANRLSIECFQTLFTGTGVHFSDTGCGINRENYDQGYFLTCHDLTSDLTTSCASH